MPDTPLTCEHEGCRHPAVYFVSLPTGGARVRCCGQHLNQAMGWFHVRSGYLVVVQAVADTSGPEAGDDHEGGLTL